MLVAPHQGEDPAVVDHPVGQEGVPARHLQDPDIPLPVLRLRPTTALFSATSYAPALVISGAWFSPLIRS